jgi:probable HAF family extracellular repeat protein
VKALKKNLTPEPCVRHEHWVIRVVLVVTILSCLSPVTPAQSGAAGAGTITDLGSLGTVRPLPGPVDNGSYGLAINSSGNVVGYSGEETGWPLAGPVLYGFSNEDAFIWTPTSANGTTGTMTFVGGLVPGACGAGGGNTSAGNSASLNSGLVDINDNGVAVGSSGIVTPGVGSSSCPMAIDGVFTYQNGALTSIGTPPGTFNIGPSSINNKGQIVGWYNVLGQDFHAWLYQQGNFFDLGQLPGYSIDATPYRINNNGLIAGVAQNSSGNVMAFLHSGTGLLASTDALGTLPGGQNSAAYGLNDQGIAVGASDFDTTGIFHGFVYQQNAKGVITMEDLGTASVASFASSAAFAINAENLVVGQSDVDDPVIPGASHAVMWTSTNQIVDLNSYLPPNVSATQGGCQIGQPNCWELISAQAINDLGQIVGIGFIGYDLHAFLLNTACVNNGGDTDGDGLCDNWEKYGYTDPKTGQFVDLPSMGANPMHKDIFVQTDYMVYQGGCDPSGSCVVGHSHQPSPDALAIVTAAFANAPVDNPDGTTGITLHVDCGISCIMNPLTGQTWGALSRANAIPEDFILGDSPCDVPPKGPQNCYNFDQFHNIANNPDEYGVVHFPVSRRPIFHYALFAHDLNIECMDSSMTPPKQVICGVTGISEGIPSSGFIVSLGSYFANVGTVWSQAGTFMHELGHNLGLHHGGLDETNWKPNYLSVMNYSFQFEGLIESGINGLFDYSEFPSIPSLNEYALNETIGLNGGPALVNYGTAYYCPGAQPVVSPGQSIGRRDVGDANGPIDWNCDGSIETDVQADIAATGIPFVPGLPIVLNSSEDWNHLVYAGGLIGGNGAMGGAAFAFGSQANPSDAESAVAHDPQAPYLVSVASASPGTALVYPGSSLSVVFTISNTGLQADNYSITTASTSFDWWNTSAVPSSISLAGAASQQITIPLQVPACLSSGTQGTFTLKAVSQTHSTVIDSSFAQLTVSPTAPPGSVAIPNVVGLTQAAAQAAITAGGFALGTVTTQTSTTVPAGTVISQMPAVCGFASPGSSVSIVVSSGPPEAIVPNVVGMTQAAAIAAMNAAGLNLGSEPITVSSPSVPVGNVVSQNPQAGTEVTAGTFFSLTIASAAPAYNLTPNVVGDPISTAMSAITAAGLNLGLITQAPALTVPDGTVVSQVPAAGSPTSPGSYVNVTVSYDYELTSIPNIVGDTQTAAISAILGAGFSIGSIGGAASNTAAAGTVILQSPLPGAVLSPTTPVSFSISTGPVGPQSFVVPNVYGLTQSAASSAITGAGLTVGTVTPSQELSVPVGDVFSQTPQPGAYAAGGSAVNLQVSAAPAQYSVPDLVTKPTYYSTAYADIIAAGLTPGTFTAQISSTVGFGNVISQSPAAATVVGGGSAVNVTYSLGIANNTVPSVMGENQVIATNSIDPGLTFFVSVTREPSTTVPDGFVISQNPPANAQAPLSAPINLVVSSGGPVSAAVPNVVGTSITGGLSLTGAEPTLNAAGFAIGSVTYQPSNSVPFGQVISQNPAAGAIAAWDTSVSLVYSSGPPASVTLPNIVGVTQGEAVGVLSAASLKWTLTTQSSQTVPAGVVISQNPSAGTTLQGSIPGPGGPDGSVPVTFVVSAGSNAVPTYSLLSQFGDYGGPYSGDGQFDAPQSLAIDPNTGNILAGDQTGRIQIFDPKGNFKEYFGGTGVQFITATVPGTNQLATFYPTGTGGGLFGDGYLASSAAGIVGFPIGLAVDPINGNVVALDAADRVLIFNSAGVLQSTFGSPGTGPGQFAFALVNDIPSAGGVAIDPVTENILVTDWGNFRVQIFSPSGVYLGQFGTQGAGNGQFYLPIGIAIDPETRNIVVMDHGNSRVEIFNSSGAYLSQFGPPARAANASWDPSYCTCQALAIDPASHNIIVQGTINGTPNEPSIQIFDSEGNYLSQFGGFGTSYTGGLALDPVSHHIVTFGEAGVFLGIVQIFGAPGAPTPTSTALTSSLNPAASGQSVTFTATASGSGPTGTVQFYYGDTPLGAPVALTSGTASFTTSTLPIGTDSITAIYAGDSNNATSSSAVLNEVISSNPATVSVASSLNPAIAGQPVTLTATVTGSNPTGTVMFMNGASSLSTAVALSSGAITFTTSSLPVGTDSITAVYSGDANNATSTSAAVTEVVTLAASSTALVSSANHVTLGQTVSFIATIAGDNPTGTVQFLDNGAGLGAPVAFTGNVATLTLSTLSAGTHPITAIYSGDKFNATSTSPVLNELISLNGATTTTLGSTVNPVTIGQSVTFTATVTGNTPTGTIQFLDGTRNLSSPVVLTAGTAAYTASGLTLGTHSITASYSGDSSNAPSTSTILSEVASQAATTTALTASVNPAAVGQPVTFTATVTGANASGPVLFMDGATLLVVPGIAAPGPTLSSVPIPSGNSQTTILANGQASITLSTLSAGTHSITAVYKGDSSNSPSASAILSEVIRSAAAPPVVTPPASISIPATQANGATSSAWTALAAFLAGATATSTLPTAPVQLAPQVGGLAVTGSTVFPTGTTTVTFSFEDANGNVGSATSIVTVTVGTPRITGSTAGIGTDPSGAIYVNVVLTNTGTGNAQNLQIKTLTIRTLSGTGTVTYNTTLSPALPLTLGNLSVGASIITKIYLNVPNTVTRISITESGPVQDVAGDNYNYSTAEGVVP